MLKIEQQRSLLHNNYLGVNAVAERYCEVQTTEQLQWLLDWCRQHRIVPQALGEGSNVVLSRQLAGLVLRIQLGGIHAEERSRNQVLLRIGAGESWRALVRHCLRVGYYGLENLAGIPGSAGAAPVQNIGAYGVELAEFLQAVEVVESDSGRCRQLSCGECQLSYRHSVFQQPEGADLLITALWLRLQRQPQRQCNYPALRTALDQQGINKPKPVDIYRTVLRLRRRLPNPHQLPNVGSFFRNPQVDPARYRALRKDHPELVARRRADGYQLSAGWMIERAGFKGLARNGIAMHQHHALVLTNPGHASGEEILAFATDISSAVQQRFGVTLVLEPRVI